MRQRCVYQYTRAKLMLNWRESDERSHTRHAQIDHETVPIVFILIFTQKNILLDN